MESIDAEGINNKILIIDDEPFMINAIRRNLKRDNYYEVLSAKNGKEGLELYYDVKPILILLDLNMPIMNGIEFLEHLKLSPSDLCSVIVLTGHGDDKDMKKCFDLGVSAFLRKPFNVYELRGLVRHVIALKQTQEALNEQREKFISVLIHDLKNPLSPIMGFTRILLEEKVTSEEDRIEKLKIIRKASEDLLQIIENTSKDLREKYTLRSFHPEKVEYNDIVLSVIANSMSEIAKRGIKIFFNSKSRERWYETEKIILKADPYQLKILAENLLGNAIKYAKGTIRVELNKLDSGIRFSISDDGPGIPEIYFEKIFEEYNEFVLT
ncbi:MAG: response regulator, partial [Nitrospinota bacterium]